MNDIIRVPLDDAIINATDDKGEERLRLSVQVDGHEVLVRFPLLKDWDMYTKDLSHLLIRLSQSAGDIDLGIEGMDDDNYQHWALLMSVSVKYKECRDLVERIFFTYLRPEAPTVGDVDQVDWIKSHMDMLHVYYMLVCILQIEDWFKKKSQKILEKIHPRATNRSSKVSSPENLMSAWNGYNRGPQFGQD